MCRALAALRTQGSHAAYQLGHTGCRAQVGSALCNGVPPVNQLMAAVRRPVASVPSSCRLAGWTSIEVNEKDFSSDSKLGCSLPITVVTSMHCKSKPINVMLFGDRQLRPIHLSNIVTRMPLFLLSNVCHTLNKTDKLSVLFSQYAPSIVCLTETWFQYTITVNNRM
jgi:hypothetical protein